MLSKCLGVTWKISITSIEQNTCCSISSGEENKASCVLLGQEAVNMHDVKFLLESMTLVGIVLKFSTHKTWKNQSKQKADIIKTSRFPPPP